MSNILKTSLMEEYDEFNSTVGANRVLLFSVVERRKEMKINVATQAREKRLRQVQALISKLTPHLNQEMRQSVSEYDIMPNNTHRWVPARIMTCIRFHDNFVDDVIREYVLSTSKMKTKRRLLELAETLNSH